MRAHHFTGPTFPQTLLEHNASYWERMVDADFNRRSSPDEFVSDYLTNLVARSLGSAPAVRPRLRSWFEPAQSAELPDALTAQASEALATVTAAHEPKAPAHLANTPPPSPASFEVAPRNAKEPLTSPALTALRSIQVDQFPISLTTQFQRQAPHAANKISAAEVARPAAPPLSEPTTQLIVHTETALRAATVRKEVEPQSTTEPQAVPTSFTNDDALIRSAEPMLTPPPAVASDTNAPAPEQTAIVARPRVTPLLADRRADSPARTDEPTPAPAPTVQVTIGRIEVRAAIAAPAAPKPRSTPPPQSLDDYLRRRRHGGAQ